MVIGGIARFAMGGILVLEGMILGKLWARAV